MMKSALGIWSSSSSDDHKFSTNDKYCSNNNGNDFENHSISDLLPANEEDLLAGINVEDFHWGSPTNIDEYDHFGSGGGLEIDSHTIHVGLSFGVSRLTLSDLPNGTTLFPGQNNGGEHPLKKEQPSRTLFVRHVNTNVDDKELRNIFKPYGAIHRLYTGCKNRGFVMISYYDIRAARKALQALQHKRLRRRKMDIHFSLPKEYPSDKDLNQGTLVVSNLEPSVSNEDLLKIFRVYGDVEEIRDTPHKRNQKFVEFYDIRDAEAALKSLNSRDLAGNIKLKPSHPRGGAYRNRSHLNQDLDQDELTSFRHQKGISLGNSPTTGNYAEEQSSNSMRVAPMRSKHMLKNGNSSHQNAFPGSASSFVASSHQSFWDRQKVDSESAYSSSLMRMQPFGHTSEGILDHGFSFYGHGPFLGPVQGHYQSPNNHHVGSAPSRIPFERHMGMSLIPRSFDFRPPIDRYFMMNPGAGNNGDGILPTPRLGGFHHDTRHHVEE